MHLTIPCTTAHMGVQGQGATRHPYYTWFSPLEQGMELHGSTFFSQLKPEKPPGQRQV